MALAADVTLVKYYNGSVDSHACKPGTAECAYNFDINIPLQYSGNASTGIKVMGLSSNTNAHTEINTAANYTTPLYMKSDVFTTGLCQYSPAGQACSDIRADYNCIFGLSGTTNAHLSRCNTFGTNEIKFCCAFSSSTTCPQINFNMTKTILTQGENATFTYNCPSITDITSALDVNIKIILNSPELTFPMTAKKCYNNTQTFDLNTAQLNMSGTESKQFEAYLVTSDNKCASSPLPFVVSTPGSTPINPTNNCLLNSFNSDNINIGQNVNLQFSCEENDVDTNLLIFDDTGTLIGTVNNILCGTTQTVYTSYKIDSNTAGIYRARLATAECYKDDFFTMTKAAERSNIPDNNATTIILVLISVITVIAFRKK
jgi:hypothetical protein